MLLKANVWNYITTTTITRPSDTSTYKKILSPQAGHMSRGKRKELNFYISTT